MKKKEFDNIYWKIITHCSFCKKVGSCVRIFHKSAWASDNKEIYWKYLCRDCA